MQGNVTAREFFDACIDEAMKRGKYRYSPEGWHSIGAFVSAVMEIDNPEDAAEFYAGSLSYYAAGGADDPASVAKANIGWCFGEGMASERIAMWQEVCGAQHPIFAYPATGEHPTPVEAFEAGMRYGAGA